MIPFLNSLIRRSRLVATESADARRSIDQQLQTMAYVPPLFANSLRYAPGDYVRTPFGSGVVRSLRYHFSILIMRRLALVLCLVTD